MAVVQRRNVVSGATPLVRHGGGFCTSVAMLCRIQSLAESVHVASAAARQQMLTAELNQDQCGRVLTCG